jgi:hypothetical protein
MAEMLAAAVVVAAPQQQSAAQELLEEVAVALKVVALVVGVQTIQDRSWFVPSSAPCLCESSPSFQRDDS